jgi:glycosyltransferase involved in cell wall biosynthesis
MPATFSDCRSGSKSVCLLITDLAYGGTPRSVQALALGLRDRGHEVHVASLLSGGEVAQELAAAGIRVTPLAIERHGPIAAARALYQLLRRQRPAVLHAFLFHANFLGRVIGRLAGVRCVIVSERSVEPQKRASRVWLDRLTWWLAKWWTVNADATAAVLAARERIAPGRIVAIPTGVDTDRFSPSTDDSDLRGRLGLESRNVVAVCIGRLDRLKGHDTLVDAFARVAAARPHVHLLLVGEGAERNAIEARAAASGIGDRVHWAGSVADVRPYLRAADLFVLASDAEGTPGAVLEAMAMGLPVVATCIGGTPEAVADGETGLLVAPRDSAALAAAMLRLIDDPESARRMGERGRARAVERYSMRRVLDLTEALYARTAETAERRNSGLSPVITRHVRHRR